MTTTAPPPARGQREERFLSVLEVAAQWRVSKMTVYRLIDGGSLQAVRFGRSLRVPVSAVRGYELDHDTFGDLP